MCWKYSTGKKWNLTRFRKTFFWYPKLDFGLYAWHKEHLEKISPYPLPLKKKNSRFLGPSATLFMCITCFQSAQRANFVVSFKMILHKRQNPIWDFKKAFFENAWGFIFCLQNTFCAFWTHVRDRSSITFGWRGVWYFFWKKRTWPNVDFKSQKICCLPIKTVNDSCASFLAFAFTRYLTFSSSFYLFHSKPSTILLI